MEAERYEPVSMGTGTVQAEFVPVTFAETLALAERLRTVLERQSIPALVEDAPDDDVDAVLGRGVPVLVPEEMHDLASEIVAEAERGAATLRAEDDEEEEFVDDDDEEFDDDDFDDLDDLDDDYEDDDDDEFESDFDDEEDSD